eukprot:SM006603S20131  [mRNA]  locus=s6603:257:651:- [translate_table: standard]
MLCRLSAWRSFTPVSLDGLSQERELEALEAAVQPSWPGLVQPLERLGDRLAVAWGAVNHLKAVRDSEALRTAVDEVQSLPQQCILGTHS